MLPSLPHMAVMRGRREVPSDTAFRISTRNNLPWHQPIWE